MKKMKFDIQRFAAPAANKQSAQFISIQKLHVAKMTNDGASGTTYETPIGLGKVLRNITITPTNNSVDAYADGQVIDTAALTSNYQIELETAALPLEYIAYLLGHTYENGVMKAGKDDVAPYFAMMFQSDKRNGEARYSKFYKVQFSEPTQTGKTAEETPEWQFPTISAKAIYRLSDGLSYAYGDDEDTSFDSSSWYTSVDGGTSGDSGSGTGD